MQGGEAYPASDLYSLGATCFHLLSGVHPWELWKKQGYGWVADWRQHLPQPLSQELGQILDKLLLEDHLQRYQSAAEVLQELNQPPPSPVPPTTQPTPPPAVPPTVTQAKPSSQPVVLKHNAKLRERLLLSGAIALLALVGTQIYSYIRYGLFPTNPIFTITGLPNSLLLERTLTGHSDSVISVAISSDGKTLASGSGDKTIKIWRIP
ncbi:MAG: hypothetical protein PUP91_02825 [Rhizonema sp. PD37]|nr:hypothetical protein [Rhizonema sp. PD37]